MRTIGSALALPAAHNVVVADAQGQFRTPVFSFPPHRQTASASGLGLMPLANVELILWFVDLLHNGQHVSIELIAPIAYWPAAPVLRNRPVHVLQLL